MAQPSWLKSILPSDDWIENRKRRHETTAPQSLVDFIASSPNHEAPLHLQPILDTFEEVCQQRAFFHTATLAPAAPSTVKRCFSVPPRHWKSTTILHGLVWLMRMFPGYRVLYLTYNQDFADHQSREAQRIAGYHGETLGDRQTFSEWNLSNGSVFRAAGLIGGATGEGFDLIVVDDPYRKRQDAESLTIRRRTSESFTADVFTRQGNYPTSFIIVHTRWHLDDLIGEVTQPGYMDGHSFDWINLPAISPEGLALLPKYWPLDRFKPHMANAYEWSSQYMGNPVPKGAEIFGAPTWCELADIPRSGRASHGIDLAYTAKTQADYSVSLLLRQFDGRTYVADVIRRRVKAEDFVGVLKDRGERFPGMRPRWHCAGAEFGVANLLAKLGAPVDAVAATADKIQRSAEAAIAWNAGQIFVPRDAPWAKDFVEEISRFTGVGDTHDDQVDALASAWSVLDNASDRPVESWDRGNGRSVVGGFRNAY